MEIEALVLVVDPREKRLADIAALLACADREAFIGLCASLDGARASAAALWLPDDLTRFLPTRCAVRKGYLEAEFTFGSDGDDLVHAWVHALLLAAPGSLVAAWGCYDEGPYEFWLKGKDGKVEEKTATPLQSRRQDEAIMADVYTWWHEDLPPSLAVGTLADRFERYRSKPPAAKKAASRKPRTTFGAYAARDLELLAGKLTARNIHAKDKQEIDLFVRALADGEHDVARLMIEKGYDIHHDDEEYGRSLLHQISGQRIRHASTPENLARSVSLLVELGLDVDELASYDLGQRRPPLMAALDEDNVEVALALIEAGADVNMTDRRGRTALFFLSHRKGPEVVTALLDAGADVNHLDSSGQSALFPVAGWNYLESADALIRRGIDVNHRDNAGRTALHHSLAYLEAKAPGETVAHLLLKHGADPRIESSKGERPFDNEQLRAILGQENLLDRS